MENFLFDAIARLAKAGVNFVISMETRKTEKTIKSDPLFDGHLQMDITKLSPKDKLLYISRQIQLKHFIETKVKKISKKGNQ